MKAKKILFLAILSGLMTTILFYMFIKKENTQPVEQAAPMVELVVASQDIKKNQKITEEALSTATFPEAQVHPNAVENPKTIVGQYTSSDIKQGEVIMSHRIQQVEEEADVVSKKIKEGYRAVSISTDYVKSVSNLIEPEDFVDVVLSEANTSSKGPSIKTELILEKVKVLSVGQRMIEVQETEATEAVPEGEYMAITLELNQEDSIALINASERGNLQLLLNSKMVSSEEDSEVEAETLKDEEPAAVKVFDNHIIPMSKKSFIRAEPNLKAPIISVVDEGVSLRYLDEQETDKDARLWLHVETPDKKTGWISSRIIKHEDE